MEEITRFIYYFKEILNRYGFTNHVNVHEEYVDTLSSVSDEVI